ncbi:SGNH/GDSL hydrolase family protein [Luteolibacter algae]|uniref:SGNH/GDSL hydrolase family protein n=1 Tax=Luteolibacter algae TaxID=454151 RepID=UPI0036DB1307
MGSKLQATSFKLVAIGDSLTEEYTFEIPFSYPGARNWVEILHAERPSEFSMGAYDSRYLSYPDRRNGGYEFNYGIPGYTTRDWEEVLYDPGSFSLHRFTRNALDSDLQIVDAALIFLGGNDLKSNYTGIYADPVPPPFLADIPPRIIKLHSYIRNHAPAGFPIIIATLPDISATPDITGNATYQDPARAIIARQRIASVNASLIGLASALPDTYIARIDSLTDRIHDQSPFELNGTEFTYFKLPEGNSNPPLHLFTHDGFHPNTAGQALLANEILKAINQFAQPPIPLMENREILSDVLAQNPDQPYLDWAGTRGGPNDNPDGDALPNLMEFLLATDPSLPNAAFTFSSDGTASYLPDASASRYATLTPLQSATLNNDWVPVPPSRLQNLPDGTIRILPSSTDKKLFYIHQAVPNP